MLKSLEGLNWVSILAILVAVETQIGNGSMSLTNLVPEAWAPYVKTWAADLGTIGALILAKGSYGKTVPPEVKSALLLAVLLGSLVFPQPASAQVPRTRPALTGNIVNDIAAANPRAPALTGNPLGDIIGALDVKLLPDLQYALLLATASGSKVTGPCYQAWIDIINVRQKAVQDAQGQALTLPDPHLITDFEKLVELRNSLQPDSEFMIKCSPVASMVKKDIVGFIGIVISGGAGLATMVPGL
jgi:hypothetical protein